MLHARRAGRGSVEANTVKPLSKNPGALQQAEGLREGPRPVWIDAVQLHRRVGAIACAHAARDGPRGRTPQRSFSNQHNTKRKRCSGRGDLALKALAMNNRAC